MISTIHLKKNKFIYLIINCIILTFVFMSCTHTNYYDKEWSKEDRIYLQSHLQSTLDLIIAETENLDDSLWNWRAGDNEWPVSLIVEHLILHDELFYREAQVLTGLPELPTPLQSDFAPDEVILSYKDITTANTGSSPSYMEPHGRWCSKKEAIDAYVRSRGRLIEFVNSTNSDLRKYYTSSGRGPTKYRDLHQLLLISVAHTMRHHKQILDVKIEMKRSR